MHETGRCGSLSDGQTAMQANIARAVLERDGLLCDDDAEGGGV
jgi:hypothetical protein